MKPAPFAYRRPASVEEAVALLDDDSKVLAGGQSLVPLLNMRMARPARLVDVNRVPGLDAIVEDDGRIRIGALESVVPGLTGEFFEAQTAGSLRAALERFDPDAYDAGAVRAHAERWRSERFTARVRAIVAEVVREGRA